MCSPYYCHFFPTYSQKTVAKCVTSCLTMEPDYAIYKFILYKKSLNHSLKYHAVMLRIKYKLVPSISVGKKSISSSHI